MRIYTAIAALILVSPGLQAQNFKIFNSPRKTAILQENSRLRHQIDSLTALLDSANTAADSLGSILETLEEVENGKTHNLVVPEDYTPEISDSLLSLWYLHKLTTNEDTDLYNLDSVKFASNVPDEVYIQRIKDMNSFISIPYNDIVRNYIILYSEKRAGSMSKILGLCKYYMPIFQEILNKYELPEELMAMSIIESALNPLAVSRVGAKGMWQFMYNTAKRYGLYIDSFVDERMDVFKAADAAARYLKDHYQIFGDWSLAIASYNCGPGNVKKAMIRSGGKTAFWDIYPYLPRETRGYVPAFVGALYTITYYKEHGIVPAQIEMPAHVDTIAIHQQVHFEQISAVVGIPTEELRNLNPQYRHDIIPANGKEFLLRIPFNYTTAFIEKQDSIFRYKADSLFNPVTIKKVTEGGSGERIVYKVKSGDSLGKIAARHHVTVKQLQSWNRLSGTTIRIGQKLIIYTKGARPAATQVSKNAYSGYTSYTIRQGDTLSKIAAKFPGISEKDIMSYNGMSGTFIKAGAVIRIPKK